jgi:mono/diheme cytochrome c family protein
MVRRKERLYMKHRSSTVLYAAMAVGLLLSASAASAQDKAKIDQGTKVFAAQKCGVCHSVAGVGAKKGPLDGVGSKLSEDEIRQWIVNAAEMTKKTQATRKPPMKNYSQLPKEDVDALVAYMSSLKKG